MCLLRDQTCLLLVLGGALAGPAALPAQSGEASAMPVEVSAEPDVTGPNQPVRLTGSTPMLGGIQKVRITIKPPEGSPSELTAVVAPDGSYTIAFAATKATGTYQVSALAPDGRGTDTTSFRIFDPASAADEVVDAADDLLEATGSAARTAGDLVATLPASPARLEMLDSIAALTKVLARLPDGIAPLKPILEKIHAITVRYPAAGPSFAPMFERLETWAGESRAEAVRINEQVLASKAAGVKCEQIDRVTESLKLVSSALNFFQSGKPKEVTRAIGVGFANDAALDRLVKEYTPPQYKDDPGYAFMVGQTFKLIPTFEKGISIPATTAFTIAFDLVGFGSQLLFSKYCEKFEGPLTATMYAEFMKNGLRWWTYDVAIEGRLVLRYAKNDQPDETNRVNGELVGVATGFKMRENAAEVLFPDVMVGKQVVYRRLVTPVGRPYNDVEGKIVASSGPGSFRIPVEGELVGTRLTLRLSAATHDFDGAVARGMYAIAGPKTLGIPLFTNFTLPYKGAHWILTHTLVGDGGAGELLVRIDRAAKTMTIERAVEQDRPGPNNAAHYALRLKACNPGC